MTPSEAATLLGELAALDGRTISEAAALAWAKTLPDVTLAEALEAVPVHRRQSTDWLMPAHVLRIVEDTRRERCRIERETQEAEREALEAAQRGPIEDRSTEVTDLLTRLTEQLGPSDPTVLRRREWVEYERRQQRTARAAAEPNPHYRYAHKLGPAQSEPA